MRLKAHTEMEHNKYSNVLVVLGPIDTLETDNEAGRSPPANQALRAMNHVVVLH